MLELIDWARALMAVREAFAAAAYVRDERQRSEDA